MPAKRGRHDGITQDSTGQPVVPSSTKVVVTKKGRHFHHQTGLIKGTPDSDGWYTVELLDGEGTAARLKRPDFVTMVPDPAGNGTVIDGFSLGDRAAFFNFVMSCGISDTSWKKAHAFMADKEYEAVCAYAVLFLKHLGNPPGEGPLSADGSLDEGVPHKLEQMQQVLERIAVLHLLHRKALQFVPNEALSASQKEWFGSIRCACSKKFQMKRRGLIQMPMGWPPELDRRLISAVAVHGYGNWSSFVSSGEKSLDLLQDICPTATSWEVLDAEEKVIVETIIKARVEDIAISVAKEYRVRHNAGENLSAFNLDPRHVRQHNAAPAPEQVKEEEMPETRRQMVDEWAYHEPMVGPQYQAEIPNLLKRCRENRYSLQRQAILQENYTEDQEGRLIWDCHRHDPEVLNQYLEMMQDLVENNMPETHTDPHYKFCTESSLDFLHSNGGQYQQAMDSMALGYKTLSRPQVVWEAQELDAFAAAYEHYGKDFRSIAESLPNKDWKQVTDFYFKHKCDEKLLMLPKTEASAKGGASPAQKSLSHQLTPEERQLSNAAELAPSKLLALKQKLVDHSARQGFISRAEAVKAASSQPQWGAGVSENTVNKLYELLVSRQLIRSDSAAK